jgi:hypothetical protein
MAAVLKSVHGSPSGASRMAAVLKSVHANPASIVMCMSNSTSESQDEDSIHSQDDDSMSIVSRVHTVMLSWMGPPC